MKIAVATDGNYVAGHFGHCPGFTIAEVADGKIRRKEAIANPGHKPGFLPGYLADLGVTHIIAGGMGVSAQELFTARGVVPIVGVQGVVEEVIKAFLENNLVMGPSLCNHGAEGHGHGHSCGDGGCGA
ncbi:MAG: NifB/NifX family molybdenum-iron cluster-binding protein [Bacillota bacterium]